ncbi:MAG: shikimate kinase [Spirochaetales bacterium]|nr:shikimate kinase [Spirochaetales bacterium]
MNKKYTDIISLIGFMGSGKTTVGRLLSKKLGFKFTDLDKLVEETSGRTILEIFKTEGEEKFREYESNELWGLKDKKSMVISTGGGAPIEEKNRQFFKEYSFTVFLYISFDEMVKRTSGVGKGIRPLLNKPLEEVRELYNRRLPIYESLGVKINTDNIPPLEICGRIEKLLKR